MAAVVVGKGGGGKTPPCYLHYRQFPFKQTATMVIVAHMIDHSYGNLPMAVADLGEVPRGLGPPLIFRPS